MKVTEISCMEVCREISNYVDSDVERDLCARMEAHFKACAHCKAILDGTQNIVKLVADGIEYPVPEGFSKRLYNKIKGA
jgi:anti-sigma factor (TIGR02949 family)